MFILPTQTVEDHETETWGEKTHFDITPSIETYKFSVLDVLVLRILICNAGCSVILSQVKPMIGNSMHFYKTLQQIRTEPEKKKHDGYFSLLLTILLAKNIKNRVLKKMSLAEVLLERQRILWHFVYTIDLKSAKEIFEKIQMYKCVRVCVYVYKRVTLYVYV